MEESELLYFRKVKKRLKDNAINKLFDPLHVEVVNNAILNAEVFIGRLPFFFVTHQNIDREIEKIIEALIVELRADEIWEESK